MYVVQSGEVRADAGTGAAGSIDIVGRDHVILTSDSLTSASGGAGAAGPEERAIDFIAAPRPPESWDLRDADPLLARAVRGDQEAGRLLAALNVFGAATGDPGKGRDGDLPRWEPWATGSGSFLVLDSDHDGGIRMSDDTVTREAVIARIAGDPRFESDAERCEIYEAFLTWSRSMTREEIDERCAP